MRKLFLIISIILCLTSFVYAEEWAWEYKSLGLVGNYSTLQVLDAAYLGSAAYDISNGILGIVYRLDANTTSFIKSFDRGRTWSSPVQINPAGRTPRGSSFTFKNTSNPVTTLYAAYYDDTGGQLVFSRSTDGGITWVELFTWAGVTLDDPPVIAYTNTGGTDNLYIVYYDAATTNLHLKKSTNNGVAWASSNIDVQANAGQQPAMSIATIGGADNLAVTYYAANGGAPVVRISYSANAGGAWTPNTVEALIAGATLSQSSVKLLITGSLYVSYSYPTIAPASSTYLKYGLSTNSGATWSLKVVDSIIKRGRGNVLDVASLTYTPSALVISIVYSDNDYLRVLFARSFDEGATWAFSVIDNTTDASYPNYMSLRQVSVWEMYLSYFDPLVSPNGTLKFANNVTFTSVPQTVQSVTGLGALQSVTKWTRLKDASVGDNLDNGILAIADYEWDGNKFQRRQVFSGSAFYAVKRANIAAVSVNLPFGFMSRKISIETPSANTDEVCINWVGGTAVCPAANIAGNDRLAAGRIIILDNHAMTSISFIASSGTQTIYVRAWK